jgi:hypothetical protein
MRKTRPLLLLLCLSLAFVACKSKKEDFTPATPEQFVQLQTGKYIIYRVDSTVFTNSNRDIEHHFYQERHLVDSNVTDALGRSSWRVFRSVRDLAGQGPWSPRGSYLLTLTNGTLETTEDNLRFVSLATPLHSGSSWKGGRFVGTDPYQSLFNFNNDDDIFSWDFTVTGAGESETINGQEYQNVLSINAIDEDINTPITTQTTYAGRSLLNTKWAAGIGLVYQNFILWEYQNIPGSTPFYVGFGVERSILQHN